MDTTAKESGKDLANKIIIIHIGPNKVVIHAIGQWINQTKFRIDYT
jgi:hypothetical protein